MSAGKDVTSVPATVTATTSSAPAAEGGRFGRRPPRQCGGVRISLRGSGSLRDRLLETGSRNHPPDPAGKLRVPGRDDGRHRFTHAERGRTRNACHRSRRGGCGGRDDRHAVGLRMPKLIGIRLTGSLRVGRPRRMSSSNRGTTDRKGRHQRHSGIFRSGAETLSCTGKATICNMGAEVGATS